METIVPETLNKRNNKTDLGQKEGGILATTIAFAHYKGGTGKTTSCINIARFLASSGYRILVVDLDPQGNLTTGLGVDKSLIEYNMYHVVKDKENITSAIVETIKPVP